MKNKEKQLAQKIVDIINQKEELDRLLLAM